MTQEMYLPPCTTHICESIYICIHAYVFKVCYYSLIKLKIPSPLPPSPPRLTTSVCPPPYGKNPPYIRMLSPPAGECSQLWHIHYHIIGTSSHPTPYKCLHNTGIPYKPVVRQGWQTPIASVSRCSIPSSLLTNNAQTQPNSYMSTWPRVCMYQANYRGMVNSRTVVELSLETVTCDISSTNLSSYSSYQIWKTT